MADVGGDDPLFEVELMDETGEIDGVQVYVSDAFAHDHDEQVDALNESGLVADAFRLDREVIEADHVGTEVQVLEGWIDTWLSERLSRDNALRSGRSRHPSASRALLGPCRRQSRPSTWQLGRRLTPAATPASGVPQKKPPLGHAVPTSVS